MKWIGRRKTVWHPTMRTWTEGLKVGRGVAALTAKSALLRGKGTGPALAPASAGRRRAQRYAPVGENQRRYQETKKKVSR